MKDLPFGGVWRRLWVILFLELRILYDVFMLFF